MSESKRLISKPTNNLEQVFKNKMTKKKFQITKDSAPHRLTAVLLPTTDHGDKADQPLYS